MPAAHKPIQARLDLLTEEVQRHDQLYHGEDSPEISDQEYDRLRSELTELEHAHPDMAAPGSPTRNVGAAAPPGSPTVTHPSPMLSMGNAFDEEQFRAWHQRMANALGTSDFPVSVEPKMDGLAVRLEYRDGRLILAATRGDGNAGEEITAAVTAAESAPQNIDHRHPLHLRGEIYIPKADFAQVNAAREDAGLEPFANARNAAAGAVRSSDPGEAQRRRTALCIYQADFHHPSHAMNLRAARLKLFETSPHAAVAHSADECIALYKHLLESKDGMTYEADGVVFKLDQLSARDTLGETSHEPRWAIAWKWPAESAKTRLERIDISHGRFGKLTPVAVLAPVHLSGVTIHSATLHNLADMQRKDIRPGEDVWIQRAGEVIPQVTGPVNKDPDRPAGPFTMPENCPSCGEPVTAEPSLAAHWCLNDKCPARLPEQLEHFVSKRAMNIEHLGGHWCRTLIEAGLVHEDPADLYAITKAQLTAIPRMGSRSADRILAQIDRSRSQPLDRVLYGLGIYRLGRTVSGVLARPCSSVREAMALSQDTLSAMEGVGPITAADIHRGLASPRTETMLRKLEAAGVRTGRPPQQENPDQENFTTMEANENFKDKVFVVTGKLMTGTRDEIHDIIERNGGRTSGSVTKSTSMLVVGEKPGSKLRKAQELGIPVISEADLMRMAA